MFHNYKEEIEKYIKDYIKITLSEKNIEIAINFAIKKADRKLSEYQHQKDGDKEYKRTLTGIKGEIAVELFLKESFIDWSIGDSKDYNKADLLPLGLNIGIKAVEYGKFPIVHKKVQRPEIITIIWNYNTVLICGFASIPTLKKFQDDNLILNDNLRKKGTKTGFYGFNYLQKFNNKQELINCTWYRN
jgi:hypothetical protein